MKKLALSICFVLFATMAAYPLKIEKNAVFIRVIDTGAGLATVTSMPGGYYMVYDAGHWNGKRETIKGISSVVPKGEDIDLLVISHTDADHLAAVPQILRKYHVNTIIRAGLERKGSKTWLKADTAIRRARLAGTFVYNLGSKQNGLHPGSTFRFGDTVLTFVSGYNTPPESWGINASNLAEFRNAGSIIIKLSFGNKTALFTGDAVGRTIGAPDDQLIDTEQFIVANSDKVNINSDILMAPHHGADNASSTAFIKAVSPRYLIFSAGHKYHHPRRSTVERYIANGVDIKRIFRTDLGDDEGEQEWAYGRHKGQHDKKGDDDIDILIRADGTIMVDYRQ